MTSHRADSQHENADSPERAFSALWWTTLEAAKAHNSGALKTHALSMQMLATYYCICRIILLFKGYSLKAYLNEFNAKKILQTI